MNFEKDLYEAIEPSKIKQDIDERRLYGSDLFFWQNNFLPDFIVKPNNENEIISILKVAYKHNRSIYSRGGGMSYTNAYGPAYEGSIVIDLSGLNRIKEVNPVNRYITVETGCTWKQLTDALAPFEMTVDFPAPLSGNVSTIGGALSQGVPGNMSGVLGLELVMADGKILKTGSWSSKVNSSPFYRSFGPDLTGLFLGDSGIFGIKTKASIHIKKKLKGKAFASFNFNTYEDMAAAMIKLSPFDFITRRTGLDPYETQNIANIGLGDAINAVVKSYKESPTRLAGLKNSGELIKYGVNFLKSSQWTLHIKVENISDQAAEESLNIVRSICNSHGNEIPGVIPRARDAVGYSIRKFLGPNGERWVATSALFPIDRSVEIASEIQKFFKIRQKEMDNLQIRHSYITNFSQYYFLCEPCFYWNDQLSNLHLSHLNMREKKLFKNFNQNSEARDFIIKMRSDLREFFYKIGSVHVQIGDFYKLQDSLNDETLKLLKGIKSLVDEKSLLNTGKLDGIGETKK